MHVCRATMSNMCMQELSCIVVGRNIVPSSVYNETENIEIWLEYFKI